MVKCVECNEKLEEIFLGKKLGTPTVKGKKISWVCSACQKKAAKATK